MKFKQSAPSFPAFLSRRGWVASDGVTAEENKKSIEMSATLGVNLRVTCHGSRGDRKYMEDFFVLHYESSEDEHKLEYAFFGIFDGHGGKEAALFAKEHLMKFIVSDKRFWSEEDDDVLQSITNGFLQTHYAMWQDQVNWPKTSSGLPSTSGTTASIAFIRRGKIYIGHVGDSSIVLGYQKEGESDWIGKALTKDHKPEDAYEVARIESCGGKVVSKSGVPRVVWNRPRLGHKGPVRRSTPIDEIPFLAVARSLGDLWSYNSDKDEFVVSPHPDVHVVKIDVESHRCLIFGTDGLWNMLNPQEGVQVVQSAEEHNEKNVYSSGQPATAKNQMWVNPSKSLVDRALRRWGAFGARADNTSAVTLLLDLPGVPRRASDRVSASQHAVNPVPENVHPKDSSELTPPYPTNVQPTTSDPRVAIFTRPAMLQPVPAVMVPQHSNHEDDEPLKFVENCKPSLAESNDVSFTARKSQDSNNQVSHDHLQSPSLVTKTCKTTPSEPESTSQDDSFAVKPIIGKCNQTGHTSKVKEMANVETEFSHHESSAKSASHFKDAATVAVGSKDVKSFQKEENNCRLNSGKVQEVPKLQEPVQQLAETLQRHCHKRLRGKTVAGGESSNSNALSLLRPNPPGDVGIVRRRHSSVLDSRSGTLTAGLVSQNLSSTNPYGSVYQLGAKRRTRSEDKLLQAVGRLEDDLRTSDENKRTGWTMSWVNRLRPSDGGSEENNAHSCPSRRKKKWIRCSGNAIGRVKQARPSISIRSSASYVNGCDASINRDCSAELNSSRVLRSDTHSSMPVHTLRSQNVDIKASRLAIHAPSKFTPKRSVQLKAALDMTSYGAGTSSLLPAAKLLLSSSGLAKRHRQSFCGRTRSVTTRSRVKRLSK